jgi:hypothetical protein
MKKMKEGGGREGKSAEVGENLIAPNDYNHFASNIPFNLFPERKLFRSSPY